MHCLRNSVCFWCSLIFVNPVGAGSNCLAGSCGQDLFRTARSPRRFSPEVSSRIQAPIGAVLLPFTKIPRQTREKEPGGGGVTTQASHVQHGAAQRCPGKIGGVHGRWDLHASPTRSASRCIVFIMRVSFCCYVFGCKAENMIRAGLANYYGVFTPGGISGVTDPAPGRSCGSGGRG